MILLTTVSELRTKKKKKKETAAATKRDKTLNVFREAKEHEVVHYLKILATR